MTEPHWTDDVSTTPIFTTVIHATGPSGNVYVILGTVCSLLSQLDIPRDRIEKLYADVLTAGSYDAAVALVERWFPVDRDIDD